MVDNVAERLRLLVKAVLADNDTVAVGAISKASLLSTSATKLLHPIRQLQVSILFYFFIFFNVFTNLKNIN